MPLQLDGTVATATGRVIVDEVEALVAWMRTQYEAPQVDLSGCTDMHTAGLQALKVAGAVVVSPPDNPWLAAHLDALLAPQTDGAERTGEER